MLGIGTGEMLVIALVILLAVGPDRLPGMIKTVARSYRQMRRTVQDLRASTGIDDFLRDEELKELADLRKQKLAILAEKTRAEKTKAVMPKPDAETPLPVSEPSNEPLEPVRSEARIDTKPN